MKSRKPLGWYGGSCHISKNFRVTKELKKLYSPKTKRVARQILNKKARQLNYSEVLGFED